VTELNSDTAVKASGRDVKVSPKAAREVCAAVRGLKIDAAKAFLEQVAQKKQAVPFRRYNKTVPHRRGLQKTAAGRYPVKAAKKILKVIEGAEANALFKGLDVDQLKVVHAAAYPGMKIKRYTPRAMGRASPRFETLCHIEIVLEEKHSCHPSNIS